MSYTKDQITEALWQAYDAVVSDALTIGEGFQRVQLDSMGELINYTDSLLFGDGSELNWREGEE